MYVIAVLPLIRFQTQITLKSLIYVLMQKNVHLTKYNKTQVHLAKSK